MLEVGYADSNGNEVLEVDETTFTIRNRLKISDTIVNNCWVLYDVMGGIWSDGDDGGLLDCDLTTKQAIGYSQNITNLLLRT